MNTKIKKLHFAILLFATITIFPFAAKAADPSQSIINQQDWITRNQQNKLEEDKCNQELEAIQKERKRKKKEEIQNSQPKVVGGTAACFPIKEIHLFDANSISLFRQKKIAAPFLGKCMEAQVLADIIKAVNDYYQSQGYVTTQVKVPKQNLQTGIFDLKIIEGKIEKISLGKDRFIEKMQEFTAFGNAEGDVLNINDINQGMYQINRLQSNAAVMKIKPGSESGDSKIVIDNNKTFPARATISKDNLGNKFTGIQREAKDQLAAGNNSRFKNAQLKAIANQTLTAPTLITKIASADINVVGSNINAGTIDTSSNLNLVAQGEVNILSGQNTSYTTSESSQKGSTVRKSSTDVDYKLTNVASNIETNGDVNIQSGRDTNIIASNLSGANGNIIVGKYTDLNASSPTFGQEIVNNDAKLTIKSGEDYHYKLHQETKLEKDKGAMVVGAVAAVAAVAFAPATGGGSLAYFAAAGGGALTGSQGQRGRTITNEQKTTTQISSNLNFTNDLNTQSSGNTEITASNLKADNATILTGKFMDQSTNQETIINPDAQLKLNSAFNTQENHTTVRKVVPNYVGIAVVAGGAAYAGAYTEAESGSWFLGQVASSDIKFGAQLIGGSLFNIRSKSSYSNYKETEIKTDLHFNNLTTQ